ncbi:cupin domain-containing protein [Alphaproteobacteria bacterium KMM 3653]|uniref:Cupin domain-containing protein n=1 Tax=Harenicola maris TaxID=2841044 RepID=A0AAP2G9N1_9RHOB|nr:cupin domain-containing protein [Harenicola maris]
MPKIDLSSVPARTGSTYPAPLDKAVEGRSSQRLGDAAGITQFGANLVTLAPGALSSLRHWHENQDEFVVVTAGTCTLVDDQGETELTPGDCAAFPAGDANGHHLINRGDTPASFVVIGTRTAAEVAHYSDLDMKVTIGDGTYRFTQGDGSPLIDPKLPKD